MTDQQIAAMVDEAMAAQAVANTLDREAAAAEIVSLLLEHHTLYQASRRERATGERQREIAATIGGMKLVAERALGLDWADIVLAAAVRSSRGLADALSAGTGA